MPLKPTMKDVAAKAGVALGTVSKVINGVHVSEEYRLKVEEAIRELHYEVNTYARGFKTRKTGIMALILPNLSNPFFAAFANAINLELYKKDLKMLVCCADGVPAQEIECLNMVMQNKVDGVIALTYSDIGDYITNDFPIVVFDRFFDNYSIPRVASDNFSGALMAVEKLLSFGCRRIAYIRFHSVFPGESDKRRDGYLYACERHHLTPDLLDEVETEPSVSENKLRRFIRDHRTPGGELTFDGVFVHTDYHASMLIRLLKEEGFRVPDDVQIIGFDGILRFGNSISGLFCSSICQPVDALAEKCVELLTVKDRTHLPSLTLLPVSYRYGGTTKDPDYLPRP